MKYMEREYISKQLANLQEEKKEIRLLYQEIIKQETRLLDRLREIEGEQKEEHGPVKTQKDVIERLGGKEGENTTIVLNAENKKKRRFSTTRGGQIVVDYLKACGRPVPLSDIKELLTNAGYKEGNAVMRMNGIMKKYTTVQKVERGHYLYVPPK